MTDYTLTAYTTGTNQADRRIQCPLCRTPWMAERAGIARAEKGVSCPDCGRFVFGHQLERTEEGEIVVTLATGRPTFSNTTVFEESS